MRTPYPEKILKIIDDIDSAGKVPVTRLRVLEKWFLSRPARVPAFGLWITRRSTGFLGKTKGEARELLNEIWSRVGGEINCDSPFDRIDPQTVALWRERALAFPDNRALRLSEKALALHTGPEAAAGEACQLAIVWAQPRDTRKGDILNHLSAAKLHDLMRWMFTMEALEDRPRPEAPSGTKPEQA